MKRYSTMMSVLVTLALPIAGNCTDTPKAPEKADTKVETVAAKAPDKKAEAEAAAAMAKSGHASMMAGAPAPNAAMANPAGKVVETMDAGGYTYANLESNGTKTWVAYPVLETRLGDTLSFHNCLAMTKFTSKSLNRTFDTIMFCSAPDITAESPAAKPAATQAKKTADVKKIKVEKASGANAYSVEEIFAKRAPLDGKQVVVRGQVVKVSSGIMDRNWIHLQDGTGSDASKTNDLVVTTGDLAQPGDVITVSGTLTKDKDFGAGYKYAAIIEKGSVKK